MTKNPAVPLAPGVWRIPTVGKDLVNSFALVDDDGSVTLVDCGLKKAPARIVAGLAAIGKHPRDVTRILLTHVHPDHAGGAAEMARLTGSSVSVHEGDGDSARAGTVLEKPDPAFLSGRIMARVGNAKFEPFEPGPPLSDGQVLPVAGGLRIVHTPGHSPGHVSLLHEPTATLVTGDALFNFGFVGMRLSPRFLCANFAMTQHTAHRLGDLEYDVAAFTHGPEMTGRPRERIRDFLREVPTTS